MDRSIIAFVTLFVLFFSFGCVRNQDFSIETFTITWENMPSFRDAPQFSDTAIDKAGPRFAIPKDPGDPWYFKAGKFETRLPAGSPPDVQVRRIAEGVADSVFKDKRSHTIDLVHKTRFGHYVHVSWGAPEENYRGHDLNVMVNLEKKVIWWNKCD
jgi:hypothetical protein